MLTRTAHDREMKWQNRNKQCELRRRVLVHLAPVDESRCAYALRDPGRGVRPPLEQSCQGLSPPWGLQHQQPIICQACSSFQSRQLKSAGPSLDLCTDRARLAVEHRTRAYA